MKLENFLWIWLIELEPPACMNIWGLDVYLESSEISYLDHTFWIICFWRCLVLVEENRNLGTPKIHYWIVTHFKRFLYRWLDWKFITRNKFLSFHVTCYSVMVDYLLCVKRYNVTFREGMICLTVLCSDFKNVSPF